MNALRNHLGELFIAASTTGRGLHIITGFSSIDDIAGRPANQIFATLTSEFGEQNTAISRHPSTPDPVLNRLVRNPHLPSHVGNGVEFRDGSLECGVLLHGLGQRLLSLKPILAQATLVAQVTFQLPQALPVETIGS
jgi:hypothetical protein